MNGKSVTISGVFNKSKLVYALLAALYSQQGHAAAFNSSFLMGDIGSADWSSGSKVISAGIYDLDVSVNGAWRGKFSVKVDEKNNIFMKPDVFGSLLVKKPAEMKDTTEEWLPASTFLHGGSTTLNTGKMELNLVIPQAFVISKDQRWVAPEMWDPGINGAYTSYNFSYYNSHRKDDVSDADNIYLSMRSGLNLAGWSLLDNSTFQRNRSNKSGYWTNSTRYLERPLPGMNALLRVGDSYTESPWFDNMRFRGVSLRQDLRMYPDSYRTYMPVIRGMANSNAVVKIYQNGQIIHQVNVPAGPFSIEDLMPTGSRSDFQVDVVNAGGSTESFIVPFSTVSDMLRPGSSEWMLNAGKVQISNVDFHPEFVQGSYSYGVNNYLSVYGGATLNNDYQSLLAGAAVSVPYLGSVSSNIERASATLKNGQSSDGQRIKFSWSRYLPTKTNISIASYYYNSAEYLSFNDFVYINRLIQQDNSTSGYKRSKKTYSISLDQTLDDGWGRIALDAYWRDYWNSNQSTRQYSLTYSNLWRDISWSISARRTHYEYDADDSSNQYDESHYGRSRSQDENRIDLSITIPLKIFDTNASLVTRSGMKDGKYANSDIGLNGSTDNVDYNLSMADDNTNRTSTLNAWGAMRTSAVKLTGNYSESNNYRQAGFGASGSAVLWSGGLLTSGSSGTTFVILDSPGVANAVVNGNPAMKTNKSGKVLYPYAAPYRMNNFRLENNDADAEVKGNIRHVAPWAGSISYVKYNTDTRKVFVIEAYKSDGQPLPFGAELLDKKNAALGYVSQGSQMYIKADVLPKFIFVKYTQDEKQQKCKVTNPSESQRNICVL